MDKFWEILKGRNEAFTQWATALLGNGPFVLSRPHKTKDAVDEAFDSEYLVKEVLAAAKTRDPSNVLLRRHREASLLSAMQQDYVRRHMMNMGSAFAAAAYAYDGADDSAVAHVAECMPKLVVEEDKAMLLTADQSLGLV